MTAAQTASGPLWTPKDSCDSPTGRKLALSGPDKPKRLHMDTVRPGLGRAPWEWDSYDALAHICLSRGLCIGAVCKKQAHCYRYMYLPFFIRKLRPVVKITSLH